MPDTRSGPSGRRRARGWVWALILLALAAGGYWYYSSGKAAAPAGPSFGSWGMPGGMKVPVRVAQAEQSTVDVVLRAIGTVQAYNTVVVRSRVDGELQELFFEEGQKVRQGDLLARIDPRPFQVQLDQALGQQRQNQAQLENARRDLQRYQTLYKQNSIAKQQVDAQQALVRQYEGVQKSNQAAVDSARLQLGFTEIRAPLDGRLGLRRVDRGNLISQANTEGLVTITQTQPIAVTFTLPQAQLGEVQAQLRAGRTLAVELYDSSDARRLGRGQLESLDNLIDVATGTVKLKARMPNEDESLFPNQFVNVRLIVQTGLPAIVIPSAALQQGSKGAFVYVALPDDKVRVQPVVTGIVDGNRVAVSSGLQANERVVTEGMDRLRDGAIIEVVTGEVAERPAGPPSGARPARQARRSAG